MRSMKLLLVHNDYGKYSGEEAVVDKMADVAVYANHPAHVAAAGLLAGHKEARACVDYEC